MMRLLNVFFRGFNVGRDKDQIAYDYGDFVSAMVELREYTNKKNKNIMDYDYPKNPHGDFNDALKKTEELLSKVEKKRKEEASVISEKLSKTPEGRYALRIIDLTNTISGCGFKDEVTAMIAIESIRATNS